MWKRILFVYLLVVSLGCFAESPKKGDELCAEVHKTAAAIMENRQLGADMPRMMEIADGEPAVRMLVVAAYKKPRFSTEAHQQRSVSDFANSAYLACVEAYSK